MSDTEEKKSEKRFSVNKPSGARELVKQGKYRKVRFVVISDTHQNHGHLLMPEGDVLIHAGDFATRCKDDSQIKLFNTWLAAQPYKHKIVIAGNHEYVFNNHTTDVIRSKFLPCCTYLQDSSTTVEGITIYGTPWNGSRNMSFSYEKEKLDEKWALIPPNLDILITHMPPKGILDLASNGRNWGCKALKKVVTDKIKPKVHIFGHVHECYGRLEYKGINFINGASSAWPLFRDGTVVRHPIVFDYYVPL